MIILEMEKYFKPMLNMTAFGSIFTVVLEQLSCSFSCYLLTAGILQFEFS